MCCTGGQRSLGAAEAAGMTDIEPDRLEPVFPRFPRRRCATSSFLRRERARFRDTTRSTGGQPLSPVSNANATVKEELIDMLPAARRGDAELQPVGGRIGKRCRLLGALDPKHRQTFDLVVNSAKLMPAR